MVFGNGDRWKWLCDRSGGGEFENDGFGDGCDGGDNWSYRPMDLWCLAMDGNRLVVHCDGGCTWW